MCAEVLGFCDDSATQVELLCVEGLSGGVVVLFAPLGEVFVFTCLVLEGVVVAMLFGFDTVALAVEGVGDLVLFRGAIFAPVFGDAGQPMGAVVAVEVAFSTVEGG